MINLKKISRTFILPSGDIDAVKNVSLKIKKGEFIIISGPSGAGKTTLLNMVSGIDLPSSGEVMISGNSIKRFSKKILYFNIIIRLDYYPIKILSYYIIVLLD